MGFFDKIKQGLKRTTDAVSEQFSDIMSTFVKIDADSLEQLEEALILSDIGATVAAEATEKVEDIAKHQRIDTPLALRCVLKDVLSDMMDHDTELHLDTKPAVILVIGQRRGQDYIHRQDCFPLCGRGQEGHAVGGRYLPRSGSRSAGNLGQARRCRHRAPR